MEEIIEKRERKVINWLKDKYNISLILILILSFIIRLYYFNITKNQALWWDEAVYASLAKNLVLHIWNGTSEIIGESMIRPILFPFFLSLLMKIGLNEIAIRFLFVLISTVSIFFLFLAVKEMYDKKTALITSLIFSVLWIHLFYTNRIMVHIPELILLFPSIFFFVKSMKGEEFNFKYFAFSLFLLSIATLVRYPIGIIFFAFIIIFLIYLIGKGFKFFFNYRLWILLVIGVLPLLIFFIANFINTGDIFPALFGGTYLKPTTLEGGVSAPFSWGFLNYIPLYLQSLFFIFFIIGLGKAMFELIISYDFITKNKKLQNHLLLILLLILICSFFVFYLKGGEDRYLFPASISMVTFTSMGIVFVHNLLKKYNKILALIVIIIILIFGTYQELKFSDSIIKIKVESYSQQKQAFEWIKDNTPKDSILLGNGIYPYVMYYSERKYIESPNNLSEFLKIENQTDYLLIQAFTPPPDYIDSYLQNQKEWKPINAWFFDEQKTQPVVIIYKKV